MPGPAGGSHGGGFGGGSRGGGGGFGGGGFGGGPRGPHGPHGFGPRGPRRPFFRPRGFFFGGPFYGGGGFFGGLFAILMLPIVIIIIASIFLVSAVISAFSIAINGGEMVYDDGVFQDYVNEQYYAEFSDKGAFEDYLLIVVAVDEDYEGYVSYAWVGEHVNFASYRIDSRGETTVFSEAISNNLSHGSLKYSLDTGLANAMTEMGNKIEQRGVANYTCEESHTSVTSHLVNKTEMDVTAETVNTALASFTEKTGIPAVIIVEDGVDIFGKQTPASAIITIVICVIALAIAIWLIIYFVRKNNKAKREAESRNNDFNNNNNYNNYDNNRYSY